MPITLTGPVIHGKALARTFAIPTANIEPAENIDGLDFGVYASEVLVEGRTYLGVSNLGMRPTVADGDRVNLETFILDYHDDLYGKQIAVTLIQFMRPEKKFDSIDQLMEQIHKDIALRTGIS
ncbi:MAG: riboflavin kinase [Lachnospiraceae bacterium]|nr:riboflavin kinase [Lachnospiraceae bacterium]